MRFMLQARVVDDTAWEYLKVDLKTDTLAAMRTHIVFQDGWISYPLVSRSLQDDFERR